MSTVFVVFCLVLLFVLAVVAFSVWVAVKALRAGKRAAHRILHPNEPIQYAVGGRVVPSVAGTNKRGRSRSSAPSCATASSCSSSGSSSSGGSDSSGSSSHGSSFGGGDSSGGGGSGHSCGGHSCGGHSCGGHSCGHGCGGH